MIRRKDQMMFEPAPTGIEHLETMLKAIEEGRTVRFDYQSYYSNEPARAWKVIPCFLCIFEGRWYLIAELTDRSDTRRLALERMSALRITESRMVSSPDITPKEFFEGCYGIIRESHLKPRLIHLKADAQQRNYLRAKPLHESQEEIETAAEYSVFTYTMCVLRSTSSSAYYGCARKSRSLHRMMCVQKWQRLSDNCRRCIGNFETGRPKNRF